MKPKAVHWPGNASADGDLYTSRPRRRKGRMTLLEYYNTPESTLPQELIDGVRHVADAPFVSHQRVVLKLAMALQAYADRTGGEVLVAPVDVILDDRRPLVLQPDLLYLTPARLSLAHDRVHGAPDLVIEVLSPRVRIGDLDQKVHWYAEYGVREIWLYNQISRVLHILDCEAGQLARRREVEGPILSTVLPDFQRSMTDILGW